MNPGDTIEVTYRGVLKKIEGDVLVLEGSPRTPNVKTRRCINYDEYKVVEQGEPPLGTVVICETCERRWVNVDKNSEIRWMEIGSASWHRWDSVTKHLNCEDIALRVEWRAPMKES